MKKYSKIKIYYNIAISVLFVIIGIFLITREYSGSLIMGIPSYLLAGFLAIIVNSALALKWIYILNDKNLHQ